MEAERHARLVEIMARLAQGDRAACFTLLEEFGASIRAAIRRDLHRFGVTPEPGLLSELTTSAVLCLRDCAPGWRPDGGALPWVWAERRLRRMVSDHLGQHHDSLDVDGAAERLVSPPALACSDDPDEVEVLRALAGHRPEAALLLAALERVTSVRDRAILLAYEAYRGDGDPSPANTIAGQFAVTPANARQIVKRAKDKVRALASGEAEFAPLRDLALLAS